MIIPLHIILWIAGVVSLILAIVPSIPVMISVNTPASPVYALFYELLQHSDKALSQIPRTGYLTASMVCFGSLTIAYGLNTIEGIIEGKLDAIRSEIRMASKPTESQESFFGKKGE